MNTINEFSIVIQFLASKSDGQTTRCACCGKITALEKMTCSLLKQDDEWLIAWICPDCSPITKTTNGSNIRYGAPVVQMEETLLSAEEWLDTELFIRNKSQPFIRRYLYAEVQRAVKAGIDIPEGVAVIITQGGENRLRRRPLPMPFPWKGEWEWMVVSEAVREAITVADAIDCGKAKVMFLPGGNCIIDTEDNVLAEALLSGYRHE